MNGRCACGAVTVTLDRPPEYVNFCDCSVCRRLGAAWIYGDASELAVSGETRAFTRGDVAEPTARFHFCPRCGTTIHFTAAGAYEGMTHVGVNARLFDEVDLAGTPAHFPDGQNWDKVSAPTVRRPSTRFGDEPLP